MTECLRRGVRIPADLSVAGFDDIDMAGEFTPALTTVHVPAAEMGRLAAERMLARLAGRQVPKIEELRAEVLIRGSTGRPPA
jgi:DNA-binding LacI/PurR family transcriptional regulator